MKRISLIIIIISSLSILITGILELLSNRIYRQEMISFSFIGLGIGLVLLGIYQLQNRNK